MKLAYLYFLGILTLLAAFSFNYKKSTEIRDDFKKYYDHYNVTGSFVLYDQKNDRHIVYNPDQADQQFTPASTFKIFNSLTALENRVIEDENAIFKWDGTIRETSSWNADTDMRNAFKNSTVWYYQELAKRIGQQKMQLWVDKVQYGNKDITGGIDGFWLWGGLRISPNQQIDFLKRLHDNKLPFSKRSMKIGKDIMIAKDTLGCIVRAKTGWGKQGQQYVGWYVGYVTTKNNIYYFANCIQTTAKNPAFGEARIDIVYNILDKLKVMKK